MTRTERQTIGLKKWAANGYSGIFQFPTGFGKTFTAIRAIKGLIKRENITSVLVVVPTIVLKEQWEDELKIHKIKITKVMVINSAIKINVNVDFLILDELHRYAAETFSEVFNTVTSKYQLGLTATLEREDKYHLLILKHLKVLDKVTIEEALTNGWMSRFKIYNIPVPFSAFDQEAYTKADKAFRYFASQLGGKFDAFSTAQQWIKSEDKKEQGIAASYYNAMRKRKDICLNNVNKIEAIKQVIELFPDRKGLLFNPTIEFAEIVNKKLGKSVLAFHSKKGKKEQESTIKKFKDKRTKVRFLSTVKALNEGFNVPEASLGINSGSNSTKRNLIQQLGRIARYVDDNKEAIMVNFYTPETQEVSWLRKKTEFINESLIENLTLEEFINKFKI
jgi:superfamily II DNA or RNA helicase